MPYNLIIYFRYAKAQRMYALFPFRPRRSAARRPLTELSSPSAASPGSSRAVCFRVGSLGTQRAYIAPNIQIQTEQSEEQKREIEYK